MKKTILKKAFLVMMLFIITNGCSTDGGGGLDTFIGNFTNGYGDVDHPNVLFFFSATGTDAEGSFTGTENNNNTATISNFAGIYKNSYLEFTYSDGARSGKKFTGNFDKTTTNPYKITVKSGSDVINLKSL
jgi:hypothetical protein